MARFETVVRCSTRQAARWRSRCSAEPWSSGRSHRDANGNSPRHHVRILLVEDRIPDAALGSGYGRMIDTIAELQAMGGVHVALYPDVRSR